MIRVNTTPDSPTGSGYRRRILVLATAGGFTHATPVLEIGSILASRGHQLHLATNTGHQLLSTPPAFVSAVHDLGPPLSAGQTAAQYASLQEWTPAKGLGPLITCKRFFDSDWSQTYRSLGALCRDPATRPDFIVADYFAETAAKDILHLFGIQIAVVWPQMPYLVAPASYIPGEPGLQADVALTSEHASLLSRFRNQLVFLYAVPQLLSWIWSTREMRLAAGANNSLPLQVSHDHLVLVNSFHGLEVPRELPPSIVLVGPVLSDEYLPLSDDLHTFLDRYHTTVYVCLGTHVAPSALQFHELLLGLVQAINNGDIGGVIWSIQEQHRASLDLGRPYLLRDGAYLTASDIFAGHHAQIFMAPFVPQRAVLDHPSTRLFLTHGGGSSSNETLYHGVPVITLPFFFDQYPNAERLCLAGAGLSLDKTALHADYLSSLIARILDDRDGVFARNIVRMQHIARIAARRKYLAADLVEETLIDAELRDPGRGLHLQTAAARMPFWKARNWDMWLVGVTGFMATWWLARSTWTLFPWPWDHADALVRGLVGFGVSKRLCGMEP